MHCRKKPPLLISGVSSCINALLHQVVKSLPIVESERPVTPTSLISTPAVTPASIRDKHAVSRVFRAPLHRLHLFRVIPAVAALSANVSSLLWKLTTPSALICASPATAASLLAPIVMYHASQPSVRTSRVEVEMICRGYQCCRSSSREICCRKLKDIGNSPTRVSALPPVMVSIPLPPVISSTFSVPTKPALSSPTLTRHTHQ